MQAGSSRRSNPAPPWQVVLLGTGDSLLEAELSYLERTFPQRAKGLAVFEEALAHRLLAAADLCVIPSRFEPCGLVALAALRYGAVPVVASTGAVAAGFCFARSLRHDWCLDRCWQLCAVHQYLALRLVFLAVRLFVLAARCRVVNEGCSPTATPLQPQCLLH